MKKSLAFIYVAAFVLAVTSALASVKSTDTQGYIKLTGIPWCAESVPCDNTGPICRDHDGNQVFDGDPMNSTTCGNVLFNEP